eukprot:scaffold2049_cov108-Cylindrotheca_fusiformis.AAC.7
MFAAKSIDDVFVVIKDELPSMMTKLKQEGDTSSTSWKDVIPKQRFDRILGKIRSLLLFLGTENILVDDADPDSTDDDETPLHSAARMFAPAVLFLEMSFRDEHHQHHDTEKKRTQERWALLRDLHDQCELIVTAFYAKRIPCSCLDEKYAVLKAQPKMGHSFSTVPEIVNELVGRKDTKSSASFPAIEQKQFLGEQAISWGTVGILVADVATVTVLCACRGIFGNVRFVQKS